MSTAKMQRKTSIKRASVKVDADLVAIEVSPRAYQSFVDRLGMPPQANSRLRQTMQAPSPWLEPAPFKK